MWISARQLIGTYFRISCRRHLGGPKETPQPVPYSVYDREYYLHGNSGFDLWLKTGGAELEPRHEYAFAQAMVTSNDRVLDYGCGRGEIVLRSAQRGAHVVGVDYSPAAIALTWETINRAGLSESERLQILHLQGGELPFPAGTFTKIFFLDVIEHLTPVEAAAILNEFYRVIDSQGSLIVHTAPNRLYYDYGYPWFTYPFSKGIDFLLEKVRGRPFYNFTADPRVAYEKVMHVNEQNAHSLRKSLKMAGFQCRVRVSDGLLRGMRREPRYVLSRLLVKPSFWPLNHFFATDLWATAWKA